MQLIKFEPRWDELPEVTSHKIFEMRRVARNGLFSQRIFGPTKSYQGECSNRTCPFKGAKHEHEVCPVCEVEMTTSESRKKKYAKINLPFPVLNPLVYSIATTGKSATKRLFDDLLFYRHKYYLNESNKLIKILENTEIAEGTQVLSGIIGVEVILNKLIEDYPLKAEYKFLNENRHLWFIENILVIPPDFRPCSVKPDTKDSYIIDDINSHYQSLIRKSNQIKTLVIPLTENDEIYITNFKHIQKDVFTINDYVMERMSKKKGLLRSNILGKRVDFSGRAVITPDPTLDLAHCRLPYWMVLEIFKPQIVTYLVSRRICKRYNQAIKLIEQEINKRGVTYFNLIKEFCEGKTCVLNRQPTLHRLSMLAFKIKLHVGNTINIHPLICSPFNADFDGDAMAVYIPVTEKSIRDVDSKIGIWNNLLSEP
jgi:DNA-directed RNA polymerase subunit beta'